MSLPDDGRTLAIGGFDGQQPVASVVALAADGSEWSVLAPMAQARWCATAVVLPDGKVLAAGGQSADEDDSALKTAELYDPATNAWTALPVMAHERSCAAVFMLPSGRVAVLGGCGSDGICRKDGEGLFDPVKRTWEALPEMDTVPGNIAAAPVAPGMVAAANENVKLFDEESGRWLTLPHPMSEPRSNTQLVSLSASALQAGGSGGAPVRSDSCQ